MNEETANIEDLTRALSSINVEYPTDRPQTDRSQTDRPIMREYEVPNEGHSDVAQPRSNSNRAKQITIEQVDHGYIVKIGCQTIAIESAKKLGQKLTEYLKDPNGAEKKWFSGNFNL
jgi:hypothetical protein